SEHRMDKAHHPDRPRPRRLEMSPRLRPVDTRHPGTRPAGRRARARARASSLAIRLAAALAGAALLTTLAAGAAGAATARASSPPDGAGPSYDPTTGAPGSWQVAGAPLQATAMAQALGINPGFVHNSDARYMRATLTAASEPLLTSDCLDGMGNVT